MKGTSVICPFENVEVLEERYNNAIKEFWDTTLQVDRDGFFVAGGKWKVPWKKITELRMNDEVIHISTVKGEEEEEDEEVEPVDNTKKKGLQVQARIAQARVPAQWSSFRNYVTMKWTKITEKKQRIEDAIKQEAEEVARQARRAAAKPKRSRVERFFMKNLANMKTFDDESDDETFNRRNHKVLMAERKEQEEEHHKSNDHSDAADSQNDDEDEQEAILDDEKVDAEAREDKASVQQHKSRRLKRKTRIEDDSDDENLFDAGPGVTAVSKRVVTPGSSMRKIAILDDDEENDGEETNADIKNVAPITSYFRPKVYDGTTALGMKRDPAHQSAKRVATTVSTKKPENSTTSATPMLTTKKIVKQAVSANFFAPRQTKVVVRTEKGDESDNDTVVETPPHEAPRTPPRSSYKHLYQSTSKMEPDDDQIMDFVDERHVSPLRQTKTSPMVERMSADAQRKRRSYFGTKAPPGRSSAVLALDQADKSPARRNLYEGLDMVSPNRQGTSMLSSPPRKRTELGSPHSPSLSKRSTPPEPPAASSMFRGLRNLGNTCYINSSLQMLFSIPDFVQELKPLSQGRRLVESFCDTFQDVIHPVEAFVGSASAKMLKFAVDSTTDKFRGYQQRDAHEFLGHLIDEVHEEIKPKESEKKKDDSTSSTSQSHSLDELLPTDDYFRLNVEVHLTCKSCGYSRTKEEMYRYLSLDIGTRNPENPMKPTVERCLESFFEPEDREIKCEKCEDGVEATQSLRVLSRPRALLLHLKRFTMVEKPNSITDDKEISFQKNKAAVELNDKLSLDGFLSDKATSSVLSSVYSLRSIVHHIGNTANSGHYTADALREKTEGGKTTDRWVSYDDSTSTERTLEEIRSSFSNKKTAYMLLYSAER